MSNCPNPTITPASIGAQNYTIGSTGKNINIPTWTVNPSTCPSLTMSYKWVISSSQVDPLPSFITSPSSLLLNVYSLSPSNAGSYTIRVRGTVEGFYE